MHLCCDGNIAKTRFSYFMLYNRHDILIIYICMYLYIILHMSLDVYLNSRKTWLIFFLICESRCKFLRWLFWNINLFESNQENSLSRNISYINTIYTCRQVIHSYNRVYVRLSKILKERPRGPPIYEFCYPIVPKDKEESMPAGLYRPYFHGELVVEYRKSVVSNGRKSSSVNDVEMQNHVEQVEEYVEPGIIICASQFRLIAKIMDLNRYNMI